MAKKKKDAFCIETDGKRHFITVPAGRAFALHTYLRNNRVHSAPPEPSFNGFDCIELVGNLDFSGVQVLLNAFA